MSKNIPSARLIIGAREKILIPTVTNNRIPARIDTGAKSSSLHCSKYWIEMIRGKRVLCANILGKRKVHKFKKYTMRRVKSSNGQIEKRYVVKLAVHINNMQFVTEFTLTDRKKMKHKALLGRRFLRKYFLVDVSKNFLLSK